MVIWQGLSFFFTIPGHSSILDLLDDIYSFRYTTADTGIFWAGRYSPLRTPPHTILSGEILVHHLALEMKWASEFLHITCKIGSEAKPTYLNFVKRER